MRAGRSWISHGNTVVTRLVVQGTYAGALLGLAPPGRPATVTGVAISRFAQGRLRDLWLQADLLGLLQQLGVLPQLDLTRTVAMAQVGRIGTLLASFVRATIPETGGESDDDDRT